MKTIADVLRECAFQLPAYELPGYSEEAPLLLSRGTTYRTSPYICDQLYNLEVREDDFARVAPEAKLFLIALGMGTGMFEFDFHVMCNGDWIASRKTQYQRAMWLFFAADLWDEGFRP